MKKIIKYAAALAAAAMLSPAVPTASAFTVVPPKQNDIFADPIYHFDDGTTSLSVEMPEGEYSWNTRPTLEVINNTGHTLFCTYWYGPESLMRPAYDIPLYGKGADAGEHEQQMLKVINETGRVGEVFRMYETHYASGFTYRIPLQIFDRVEEPLSVISKCYANPLNRDRSWNYTVVDQDGNEIADLIPDAAAIRAKIDRPSGTSSFGSSSS